MSLKARLLRGAGYAALGQLLGYVIRFGSTLILTRLLAPDLFGLMTIAAAIAYGLILFSDVGLRSAIIQDPRGDDIAYRRVVWMVNLFRGVVVALLAWLVAAGLGLMQWAALVTPETAYADPRLLLVVVLLGLAELIKSAESIELLHAERTTDFRTMVTAQVLRQAIGTGVTIVWAWLDPGVLALCAGPIVANASVTLLSYGVLTRGRWHWTWQPSGMLAVAFAGRWLLVSSVLTFMINSFDKVYLASQFDASRLGLYGIAATLGLLAQELVNRISGTVLFPVLSERHRESPATVRRDFYAARRGIELFSLLAGFVLLVAGADIIRLLYDARYQSAGTLLRAFGLLALTMAYLPMSDALLALGRNRALTVVNAARLGGLVLGLLVLVPWFGIIGGIHALTFSALVGAASACFTLRRIGLLMWRREALYLAAALGVVLAAAAIDALRQGF